MDKKNIKIVENPSPNWGGKRDGSGRPVTGRKKRCVYATEHEWGKIKEFADNLRYGK